MNNLKYEGVKKFVCLVDTLFPEIIDLAYTKAYEIDAMIDDGNPAFEHWGSEKIFATFIIRYFEEQRGISVSFRPDVNKKIRGLLDDCESVSLQSDELANKISIFIEEG